MPYRKLGPPPTKAQVRAREIYKANRKRDQRADSRMRKYYERKRLRMALRLCMVLVIGLLIVAALVISNPGWQLALN